MRQIIKLEIPRRGVVQYNSTRGSRWGSNQRGEVRRGVIASEIMNKEAGVGLAKYPAESALHLSLQRHLPPRCITRAWRITEIKPAFSRLSHSAFIRENKTSVYNYAPRWVLYVAPMNLRFIMTVSFWRIHSVKVNQQTCRWLNQ